MRVIDIDISQGEFFNVYYPLVSEFKNEFKDSLPFLQSQLEKLIELEEFEKCAKLRDLIKDIEEIEET
jgi:protein-arginine kinase activator protein McsA